MLTDNTRLSGEVNLVFHRGFRDNILRVRATNFLLTCYFLAHTKYWNERVQSRLRNEISSFVVELFVFNLSVIRIAICLPVSRAAR